MYAPLYLSNECDNCCLYCGFNHNVVGSRISLSVKDVIKESDFLYNKGFRHILLVSGEKRSKISMDYLKKIISSLHEKFESISLEIFPLSSDEYKELYLSGADGVTVYQEVYSRKLYKKVHPSGPKSDYEFRLLTPERAADTGFYRINIGVLLGLGNFFEESALLGLHAFYLKKKYWRTQLSVSFPRIKVSTAGFKPLNPISDRQFLQLLFALRIYLSSIGLVLSTREDENFRNNLISLGITQMSAESKTNPGGYLNQKKSKKQFNISDTRSLDEVCSVLREKGYDPVFKDWDKQISVSTLDKERSPI